MNGIRAGAAALLAVGAVIFAAGQTSSAPQETPKTKKSGVAKKKTTKSRSKTSKSKKASAPRGQQHPTAERYKQIEEALASRGYLQDEPTGKWGPSSVEALRSFQADHQLPPTGRLDAQSLIQLGLGPSP